uniref:(northern house mosquito) hypothetical protein n=1 Tax=Culex pipiens TaxID=7175 RepID=A0A8D8B5J6_CULPI
MAQGAPAAALLFEIGLHRGHFARGRVLAGGLPRQPNPRQRLAGMVRGAPKTAHLQVQSGGAQSGPLVNGGQIQPTPGRLDMGRNAGRVGVRGRVGHAGGYDTTLVGTGSEAFVAAVRNREVFAAGELQGPLGLAGSGDRGWDHVLYGAISPAEWAGLPDL